MLPGLLAYLRRHRSTPTDTDREPHLRTAMFACVAAGRLIQTNYQQLSATHYVFTLDRASEINHIVVLLTGVQPFADDFGAVIHILLPQNTQGQGPAQWTMLGVLSNDKPSAIFRLGGHRLQSHESAMMMGSSESNTLVTTMDSAGDQAMIGISVEPLANVLQQDAAIRQARLSTSCSVSNSQLGGFSSQPNSPLQVSTPTGIAGASPLLPQETAARLQPAFVAILDGLVDYCRSFDAFGSDPNTTVRVFQEAYRKARTKLDSLLLTATK